MNSVLRRLGLLTSFLASSMMPLSFGQSSLMTSDITAVTASTNRFAFDLYDQLAAEDNLFVSPFSISLALAMTYGGANGETATQMQDVLGFDLPARDLANLLGDLSDNLESREGFTLNLANALWAQQDSRFEPEFLLMSRLDYGATLRNLDFRTASTDARRTINAWVNQATNGIIPELLPSSAVTPDTRLILTNAIYFNALWQFPFDPDATEVNPFNAFGRESLVPTMRQMRQFTYSEGDSYQTLRLPYQGETTSMMIVLPREGAFTTVSDNLASIYETALANQSTRRVNVELPRFEMRSSFDLATILSNLGMPLAFTP
ncbi:MAG: serpin family protein, partial [Deinococcota bacterium]